MGQVFAHLFQSGFSLVDGRFSTFTKEWFGKKCLNLGLKRGFRVARNFEACPTFLIFGFLIFLSCFSSLSLSLFTYQHHERCVFSLKSIRVKGKVGFENLGRRGVMGSIRRDFFSKPRQPTLLDSCVWYTRSVKREERERLKNWQKAGGR